MPHQPVARDSRVARVPVMLGIALLHLLCYLLVTRVNALRPDAYVNLTTRLDSAIPHLPWMWPFYWLTYPFVLLGGGAALWLLPAASWRLAARALVLVTLIGATVQLLIPSQAPWPLDPAPIQRFYHEAGLVLPFANLPSMHVTYVVMAAGLLFAVTRRRMVRSLAILIACGVVVATVTLKEHFVLDGVAGLLLAGVSIVWWRRSIDQPVVADIA
jgi:hypothetical protein